jgi:hypothetical protein
VILVIIAQVLAVSVLPSAHPHERPAVCWTVAVIAAVLFLASLLAHELAHALVARRSGVTVRSVTLWMLGGVTEFEGEPPTAGADFKIALAAVLWRRLGDRERAERARAAPGRFSAQSSSPPASPRRSATAPPAAHSTGCGSCWSAGSSSRRQPRRRGLRKRAPLWPACGSRMS